MPPSCLSRWVSPASAFLLLLAIPAASPSRAEEGMWPFDRFPSEAVRSRYGFAPDRAWLDHVRLSSARLAGGCSASFVSGQGLVMTNHHCAVGCVQQVSTAERDLVETGFSAARREEEISCPEIEVNQLVGIEDVTDRINAATKGLADAAYNDARKAEMSRIEKACAVDDHTRCDVVTLYRGGLYNLYRYETYRDVRLVFAPESRAAFFGGDPDNFMFPRYDLDISFLRVYRDGKPAPTPHHFTWNRVGPADGELVFAVGNPGSTDRELTVAQLEFLRDVQVPGFLLLLAELRGVLTEFSRQGPEPARIAHNDLFGIENSYKALRGEFEALLDKNLLAAKATGENELRGRVARRQAAQAAYATAWDEIARAESVERTLHRPHLLIESGLGFYSDLFGIARTLVRGAEERPKLNETRLREFRDSALPSLEQGLFSPAPIYPELERLKLGFGLTKLREMLGTDDPFVRKVLGQAAPEDLARTLVDGTGLADVNVRRSLWNGGTKAVEASDDPMIRLARSIDGEARAIRKRYEDEVEAPIKKNAELIAKARFEEEGTSRYPDATFTPRVTFGSVQGWNENGHPVPAFTDFAGAFERATGRPPYDLPESWLSAKGKLTLSTRLNFASTLDIIGGNSGSPVISRNAEIVGLIFDGNIHSLGGAFWFDPAVNRAVAVDSIAILEALRRIYGADALARELTTPGK